MKKTNLKNIKKNNDKAATVITLCLGRIINGLHLEFVVHKIGESKKGLMIVKLNDKEASVYEMDLSSDYNAKDNIEYLNAEIVKEVKI